MTTHLERPTRATTAWHNEPALTIIRHARRSGRDVMPVRRRTDRPPRQRDAEVPARAGDVVLAALRSQVEALRAQDPRVRDQVAGSVTLMRVATRRLRSTLGGFSSILDRDHTRVVSDELTWLSAQLAEEHDIDVMIDRLTQVVPALPDYLIIGPLVTDLERTLGQRVTQGEHTVLAALRSQRYQALQDLLQRLLDQPPLTPLAGQPALVELPRSVAKAVRKLNRRLDTADALPPGPDHDVALHEARKACKQVRYMTEVLAPVIGEPARDLHRQTEKLQELLGNYQDAVQARPLLRGLAESAHARGHNAFTYGLLYAIEHARMQQVLRELPHRVARLREDHTLSWLPPDMLNHTPAPLGTPPHPTRPARITRNLLRRVRGLMKSASSNVRNSVSQRPCWPSPGL